jgi:hypothetical protein
VQSLLPQHRDAGEPPVESGARCYNLRDDDDPPFEKLCLELDGTKVTGVANNWAD